MHYNKLVRDNIPDIIRSKGGEAKIHIADEVEYGKKLKEKLNEEVAEFQKEEKVEELANILEVLDALIVYRDLSWEELRKVQAQKREKRGGFEKRIILDEA